MDIERIKEGINKTGFILEYKVCKIFEQNGWSIINNRYYLDDVQEINREIDIIAYKAQIINDVYYYTSMIISCKKSESNIWAFLTKNINEQDPNINFCPISNWSNNKILNFMMEEEETESKIWDMASQQNHLNFVYSLDDQVFAFQQMNKNNYSPQNDKDIYNSIISSIKALEYEKNSLDKRIERKAFYNFNLLSIFDGEMIKIHFNEDKESIQKIDEVKYLNRHIVNKKEGFYRVHFMKFDKFDEYIGIFNEFHSWNVSYYSTLINRYYENFINFPDNKGIKLFHDEIEKQSLWYLNMIIGDEYKLDEVFIKYDNDKDIMLIGATGKEISFENEQIITEILNDNEDVLAKMREVFLEVYRYEGEIKFEDYSVLSLPF